MINYRIFTRSKARVAKLADALDLGSSVPRTWGFESLLSHFTGFTIDGNRMPSVSIEVFHYTTELNLIKGVCD
jgi:hypothetical protein